MRSDIAPRLCVGNLLLRAATLEDDAFLRTLYRSVRQAELAQTQWPEEAIAAFCDSQFTLQDRHYRAHYPHARFFVIEDSGERLGRIYVSDAPDMLRLMEFSLIAQARGRGHGKTLLAWLTTLADASGRTVGLHVEPDNPARLLYERFGFIPLERSSVYLEMRRPPQ